MPVFKAITLSGQAAVGNSISLSQKPAGGGVQSLVLNGAAVSGGIAIFPQQVSVTITSTGNESALTFVITGKDYNNQILSESITGPNATTVTSVNFYEQVTSVTVSGNTAGNITVGNGTGAASPWWPANYNRYPVMSLITDVPPTAILTYTVEYTGDNLQAAPNASATAYNQDVIGLIAQTTSQTAGLASGVCGVRIVLNSWTSGSVTLNILQSSATFG